AELLGVWLRHGAHPSSGTLRHHRSDVTCPCSRPIKHPREMQVGSPGRSVALYDVQTSTGRSRALIVTRVATLPRLAWAAQSPADGGETRAVVGEWVDADGSCLVEGAWNGEFSKKEFADSYSFMGTGLIETARSIVAVAPCNTMEAIYSLTDARGFFVSNSIPLLLGLSGHDLDAEYLDYEAD